MNVHDGSPYGDWQPGGDASDSGPDLKPESREPPPSEQEPSESAAYVVGIGASAGGLAAIKTLLDHLEDETDAAFVVSHPSPDFGSSIEPVLGHHTGMAIRTVDSELPVQPNTLYVIPPGRSVRIADGKLVPSAPEEGAVVKYPVDSFLRSLARDRGIRSVAVILSGAGSDGALGIGAVKEAGGLVLVQDEFTPEFDGMPRSAAATGLADLVLRPERIAEKLQTYLRNAPGSFEPGPMPADASEVLDAILDVIAERSEIDLGTYRREALYRRVRRRMTIHQIGSLEAYLQHLRSAPEEVDRLRRDLVTRVAKFFRDPEAFRILTREVLPSVIDRAREDQVLQAWVVGCSTGEETYSLTILLDELLRYENIDYEVFGTDLDRELIERATEGAYPLGIEADLNGEVLERFFIRDSEDYRVQRRIRDRIEFSVHDVVRDPPLRRMHLIVCRNVLDRLQPKARAQALGALHAALEPDGVLLLGPEESTADLAEEFTALDERWNIFEKKAEVVHIPPAPSAEVVPGIEMGTAEDGAVEPGADAAARIRDLEEQLQSTRETLQSTIGELEAMNEEMRSTDSELQELERALRESEEQFRGLAERSRDVYWIYDATADEFDYVSQAYESIWGYPTEMLYDDPSHWLDCVHADDRERVRESWRSHLEEGGRYDERFRVVRWDGRIRRVRLRSLIGSMEPGRPRRAACRADDITELVELEDRYRQLEDRERELHDRVEELESSIHSDPLTTLLNRRGLERILAQQLSLARRTGAPMVAILLDCDGFRDDDPSAGPDAWDAVLRTVAARLRESVRPSDWVARVGPDEFLLLLPDTRIAEGIHVSEKLRQRVAREPIFVSGANWSFTPSVGVVALPPDGTSVDDLVRLGRQAIERSARTGEYGEPVEPEEVGVTESVAAAMGPADPLAEVTAGKGMRAVAQPIHELQGDRVVGFELLVRGPEGGLEEPIDLFTASMERQVLSTVDRQCLRVCLAAAERLRGFGITHVNLFPSTLLEMSADELTSLFGDGGDLSSYCLEISEQQVVGDPTELSERLREPRGRGLRIAMDDVDFGRSCLEALIVLKPDVVKIDRSLVRGVAGEPGAARRLERFVSIARGLGAEIIAEGIETQSERDALAALGITQGQGFLWGAPYAVPMNIH